MKKSGFIVSVFYGFLGVSLDGLVYDFLECIFDGLIEVKYIVF